MIQSMTGFGKAVSETSNKKISIEIKSLNSKQLDMSARIPNSYREKEMEIRSMLSKTIERGKVDFNLHIDHLGNSISTKISQGAIENYYNQINHISKELNIPHPQDWYQSLLRLPEVTKTETISLDEEEWKAIKSLIQDALNNLTQFRIQEGEMLYKLFIEKIENIASLLKEIEKYENERLERIKGKIMDGIKKLNIEDYDTNRLEQEMIYYIEKLDINEEKSRLKNHLDYFLLTMDTENNQGRKLGFIAQEIGREVNTLGSKSNHAEMQKIVVQMKDELEQIKEQVLNVL
jgi:TIGR00255 family protein